jgi:hypothetical protein
LKLRPEYQDAHAFPVYRRYGYAKLDDFVDNIVWNMNYQAGKVKQYTLQYVGTRFRYRLQVPITTPGTSQLIYNFYPDTGTPDVNFSETNDPFHFFGTA